MEVPLLTKAPGPTLAWGTAAMWTILVPAVCCVFAAVGAEVRGRRGGAGRWAREAGGKGGHAVPGTKGGAA